MPRRDGFLNHDSSSSQNSTSSGSCLFGSSDKQANGETDEDRIRRRLVWYKSNAVVVVAQLANLPS